VGGLDGGVSLRGERPPGICNEKKKDVERDRKTSSTALGGERYGLSIEGQKAGILDDFSPKKWKRALRQSKGEKKRGE